MSNNLSGMDLAGLIRRMKGDRSYEQLAAACGEVIGRQRWQQLGVQTSSAKLPEPATLRAIATALGVSERVVVLAAARTAGLQIGEDGGSLATLLPPSVDHLSDTQVAAVLSVIRALLETHYAPAISQPAEAGAPQSMTEVLPDVKADVDTFLSQEGNGKDHPNRRRTDLG